MAKSVVNNKFKAKMSVSSLDGKLLGTVSKVSRGWVTVSLVGGGKQALRPSELKQVDPAKPAKPVKRLPPTKVRVFVQNEPEIHQGDFVSYKGIRYMVESRSEDYSIATISDDDENHLKVPIAELSTWTGFSVGDKVSYDDRPYTVFSKQPREYGDYDYILVQNGSDQKVFAEESDVRALINEEPVAVTKTTRRVLDMEVIQKVLTTVHSATELLSTEIRRTAVERALFLESASIEEYKFFCKFFTEHDGRLLPAFESWTLGN